MVSSYIAHIQCSVRFTQNRKRLAYKLFLLKRIRPFLPTQSRIMFFNYYIKQYWSTLVVYGESQENINKVVKLQKRAARLILDADFNSK